MPWLTIIMALLSFFASKKSGASNTKALVTAGLVGGGTYYVSHETEWGRSNLGSLDGVDLTTGETGAVITPGGEPVIGQTPTTTTAQPSTGVWDVLKSWGGTGTAAVIGTGAAAAGGLFNNKLLLWGGIAVVGILLLKG